LTHKLPSLTAHSFIGHLTSPLSHCTFFDWPFDLFPFHTALTFIGHWLVSLGPYSVPLWKPQQPRIGQFTHVSNFGSRALPFGLPISLPWESISFWMPTFVKCLGTF
jgi:hypothetical protein